MNKQLMPENLRGKCIDSLISKLKSNGMQTADIIKELHKKYSIRDMLESMLGHKYIIKSILIENVVVINPQNYEERDGILVLQELIENLS